MTAGHIAVTVPMPPRPFAPLVEVIEPGSTMFRVHHERRGADQFNPGLGGRSRFAPFGTPSVPTLYAAETEQAAISETILHDLGPGASVDSDDYERRVMSRIRTTRALRLASLLGMGPRKLGITADQVTATPAHQYPGTVRWAEAAYDAGFDGIAYMSRLCNSDRAYVVFRRDGTPVPVETDPGYLVAFGDRGPGRDRLTNLCSAVDVDVTAL